MHRFDTKVLKTLAALVCVACLALGSAQAAVVNLTPGGGNGSQSTSSVLLSDLIADPTSQVTVGDKIFSTFGYSKIGDMPESNQINVLGIKDLAGNWGLTFHGSFIDLPGNGPSDALIRYLVEVDFLSAQQGWRITDAHVAMGGVGAGPGGFVSVDETFAGQNNTLNAYFSRLGPNVDSQLSDVTFFTPGVTQLLVTKDVFARAEDGSTQIARTTAIDQTFSQTLIPEPATAAMLGFAGVALVAVRRRRG